MEKILQLLEPRSALAIVIRVITFVMLIALADMGFSQTFYGGQTHDPVYHLTHAIVVGGPFVVFFFVITVFQARLLRRLSRLSRIDGLTGLNNRHAFMELTVIRHKAANSGVLLLLDADCFKRINDKYGHQTGDSCLKSIGYMLKRQLREKDVAGRIGGEEFAIFLNNTSLREARSIAERFTKPITFKSALDGAPLSVTLSIGAVTANRDQTLHEMLAQADRGLYQAKANGRARIVVWDDLSTDDQILAVQ